ncbi:tetraspanin-32 isoform X1 [Hyperolius riggenbachi]|uniref:tetraspanin-32 isoform X1 n=1 Tax=Hyperolius riggenbachi TaxID=752182 RepID=UPI0035A361BE
MPTLCRTKGAVMRHKSWVRVARCQLLVSCLFILLLAVACCFVTVITSLSPHFTILIRASTSESLIRGLHHSMVLFGSIVCSLLLLTVLISSVSVLRESQQLMATAFVGFGFLFCILMAGITWTQECESQIQASFLDVYDDMYEQVYRWSSAEAKEQLLHTHDVFQCCGKTRGHVMIPEIPVMCETKAEELDCVSVISRVLHMYLHWTRLLLLMSLGFMVYGMVLSSFLYFSLPKGHIWDRRGEYSLNNGLISNSVTMAVTPLTQLLPNQSSQ